MTLFDPVCGQRIAPETAARLRHDGRDFVFCSEFCRARFRSRPEQFSGGEPTRRTGEPLSISLEEMTTTLDADLHHEITGVTRRLGVAVVLTLGVVMMERARAFVPAAEWGELILSTPVVGWAGWPFFTRAWSAARRADLVIATLIAMGTGVAWIYSVVATVAPGLFPASFSHDGLTVDVYFESAAIVTTLALLGRMLELRARNRVGVASALRDLTPEIVSRYIRDGDVERVPLEAVEPGDRLQVRPGEVVPVDGTVVTGRSSVDETLLTGDATLSIKTVGDPVTGGTRNVGGILVVRAERIGRHALLARIVAMVSEAQASRTPTHRAVDRLTRALVPAAILAAVLAATGWALFGPEPRLSHALVTGVTVLIVACPAAVALATPTSTMAGMDACAQVGVLIQRMEAFERLPKVDTVLVELAALTRESPTLTQVIPAERGRETELLRLAAGAVSASTHPLAVAVVAAARGRGLALPELSAMTDPGPELAAAVDGRAVRVAELERSSDDLAGSALEATAEGLQAGGVSVLLVRVDGTVAGLLGLTSEIKPGTTGALNTLRESGVTTMLVGTGGAEAAENISRRLGLALLDDGGLPERTSRLIEQLRADGRVVAMAADSFLEAPALAVADVGVALGSAAEMPVGSAGICLPGADIAGIVRARRLAERTRTNTRQNLALALGYNVIAIPIAAGVLFPAFGVFLTPGIAATAALLSTLSVMANALRFRVGSRALRW